MKKLVLIFLGFVMLTAHCQITIDRNDMPNIGDTIRRSIVYSVNGLDFNLSGVNHVWDFSSLGRTSQKVESFFNPSVTPTVYQLAFNLPFDPNRATICNPQSEFDTLTSISLTNTYSFFRESSSVFSFLGMGATLNNVPLTIKYNNPDVLYRFPLTMGATDSSTSSFSLNLSGTGYLATSRHRVNHVDGWGSLTTPLGTFNTVRVKSIVTEFDSVYIDSLQVGVPINRYYTEYKWLGDNAGLPLLEITEEGTTITVKYKDIYHVPVVASLPTNQQICRGESVQLSVIANGGTPPYTYLWVNGDTSATINANPLISMAYSVVVTDAFGETDGVSTFITVHQLPQVSCGNDTTIFAGNSVQFFAQVTGGNPPYNYFWFPDTGLNNSNISNPVAFPYGNISYNLVVSDSNSCVGRDTIEITVIQNNHSVSGSLTYDNASSTEMANVTVYLKNANNVIIQQCITNSTGEFTLSGIQDGNYSLDAFCTKAWGGCNATDALLILTYFTGTSTLSGLRLKAGDSDNSGYVNSVDALLVAKRFVGIQNYFPAGDWVFEKPLIAVSGSNITINLKGLCVGEVDGSYIPQN